MNFSRPGSRAFAVIVTAVIFGVSNGTPAGCSPPTPAAACQGSIETSLQQPDCPSPQCPGQGCPIFNPGDDFICIAGGCRFEVIRDCVQCGPILVKYWTEDLTAKAGDHYVAVQSGRLYFPAGAKSATLVITTMPDRLRASSVAFRVVLSIDGHVIDDAVGTIHPSSG